MPTTSPDYFRYLPATPDLLHWGIGVTAAGYSRISKGVNYPPSEHPQDHELDWNHGRVLDALQIVLISAGGGWLETQATGMVSVEAGMAFLLLPGTWHRYRPDPARGWTESWIEVQGPVVKSLLGHATFPADWVIRHGVIDLGLEETLDEIHRGIRAQAPGFHPERSACALKVLAICSAAGQMAATPSRLRAAVLQAERHLNEHHAEPVNVADLAKLLGVAYSHFRRAFREQTGFSPWKYVIHLRLTRARRLLASSDATLDDIASKVGFSSGFHLSNAFKKTYGQSPDHWRRSLIPRT